MQAVILAAGRSTRTYPLTSSRPKPLIPIWDRPLLEHQLAQLDGIAQEAILVVGYRREQIEAHLGSEHRGIKIRYVEQVTQRGTADAVLAARDFVRDRLLILNGDDFYHREDLSALAEGGRGLLVTQAPDPHNRAVVEIVDDAVTKIVEKPPDAAPGAWCSVGGYCVEPGDLSQLDDLPLSSRGELELPDFIGRLMDRARVRPQRIGQWWLPLTYAWDVLTAINTIWCEEGRARDLGLSDHRGELPRGCTVEGPVWIADGVHLSEDVRIVGPSSIGPGCVVGAGTVLDNVALFDDVAIGAGSIVESSVLGAKVRVGAGTRIESRPGQSLEIKVKEASVVPELARLGAVIGDNNQLGDNTVVPAGSLIPEA